MSVTQGSPLPNITTTQQQITAAPSWYSDYLSNLAQKGAGTAQFTGTAPLQQQAFNLVGQQVGGYSPTLEQATNLATQAGAPTGLSTAAPYLQTATALAPANIAQYMNPYTESVVEEIGRLGQEQISRNLSPQATAAAVGSGQFGSTRGARVLGDVINAAMQNIRGQQLGALQTGYQSALAASQADLARQLTAGQLAGQLSTSDMAQRLAAAGQLGNLAQQQQSQGLADINALATLGSQQQQIAQAEQLFPLQLAAQQAGLLRGYTIPTSVASTYTGPIPGAYSPSPLQQVAGITSLLGGLTTPPAGGGSSPLENIIGAIGRIIPSGGGGGGGGEIPANDIFGNIIYGPGGGYTTSGGYVIDPSEYSDLF